MLNEFFNGAAPGGGGPTIQRSLRFNSGDSTHLSRTPSSAGNRRTFTWSNWIKRSELGNQGGIFSSYTGSHPSTFFRFNTDDTFQLEDRSSSASNFRLVSDAVFRDPGAWFHLVVSVDTTQATASDRVKIYINGEQVTSFSTENYPSQNLELDWNTATEHRIGRHSEYLDGYLAEIHCVDGQALAASDFGKYDDNNVWQPINFNHSNKPANLGAWPGMTTGTPLNATYSIANLFDGNTSTRMCPIGGSSCVFTPTTPITVSSSIRIFGLQSSTNEYFKINDTVVTNVPNSFSWFTPDIGSTITSLNKFEFFTTSGSFAAVVGAIEIDGEILTIGDINSFHLDFSDNSSNAALGTDSSGNSNTWTVNNISTSTVRPTAQLSNLYGTSTAPGTNATWNVGYISVSNVGGDPGNIAYLKFNFSALGLTAPANITFTSYQQGGGGWSLVPNTIYTDAGNTTTTFTASGNIRSNTVSIPSGATYFALPPSYSGTSGGTVSNAIGSLVWNGTPVVDADNDLFRDSPTNGDQEDTGVGGEVVGNYATLNPLALSSNSSLSNGNLEFDSGTGGYTNARSTIGVSSGKWYAEFDITVSFCYIGIALEPLPNTSYGGDSVYGWVYHPNGSIYHNNVATSYGATFGNDLIGVAFDADNRTVIFYKNGVSQGSYSLGSNAQAGDTFFFVGAGYISDTYTANFGQHAFAYTAPSGYKALCTANLTDPTIADGSTAMDVALWTGNGSTQTISGLNFSPDFVWMKARTLGSANHGLFDIVRGATKRLISNSTAAESTQSQTLTAFNSDGFDLGTDAAYNGNTYPIVGWTWDGGSSTVTNTDGSITSQVRANPTAGFSIVTWTTSGTTGDYISVGHGLNALPGLVITKTRSNTDSWYTAHGFDLTQFGMLNSTNAFSAAGVAWGDGITSSVIGMRVGNFTANNYTHVAYCFAPVDGYSSFGSYTGNGSADGPFVYTGFRPSFVLIKRSDAASAVGWYLWDSKRDGYNDQNNTLNANTSNAEYSATATISLLSNGFKLADTYQDRNLSGGTYIYAAFAEHPFKTARAR